jgi:ethanolamine ammonia-lyase large subunit
MSSASREQPSPLSTHNDLSTRYRTIQGLIVDYAIGMAILGLNPFDNLFTPTLIVAVVILLKMVWDIAKRWYFPRITNLIALGGGLINVIGALAMALMAWLTMIFLGGFIPLVDRFALSAAFMTGTWTLGAAANQFFLNAFLNRQTIPGEAATHG